MKIMDQVTQLEEVAAGRDAEVVIITTVLYVTHTQWNPNNLVTNMPQIYGGGGHTNEVAVITRWP